MDVARLAEVDADGDVVDASGHKLATQSEVDAVVINVQEHGALGTWDGSTGADDTIAISNAIAAGQARAASFTIKFPSLPAGKYYKRTTPLPNLPGIKYVGDTRANSRIFFTNTSAMAIVGSMLDIVFEDLALYSYNHLFDLGTGDFYRCTIQRCLLWTGTATASWFHQNGNGNFLANHLLDNVYDRASNATVPGMDVINGNGAFNNNVIDGGFVYGHLNTLSPAFRIEGTSSSTYLYGNVFRNLIGEQNCGGLIHAYTVDGLTIENCTDEDAGTTQYANHVFIVSTSASSTLPSHNIRYNLSGRIGGSLATGMMDFWWPLTTSSPPRPTDIEISNPVSAFGNPVIQTGAWQVLTVGNNGQNSSILTVGKSDAIWTPGDTSGNLPPASSIGAGAFTFNTSFNQPVWSDNTVLRNAVGQVVPSGGLKYVTEFYPNAFPTAAQEHSALAAACAAASLIGGTVVLPPVQRVVGTFSMAGYSCSMIGYGTTTQSSSSNTPKGSVIQCSSQTGPVLDFTGFIPPHNFVGRLRFENFTVQGDGTADSSSDTLGSVTCGGGTKKGIYLPSLTALSVIFKNLLITNCGGIHFDATDMYLSVVEDVVVTDPISAAANNVPYVRMRACNGTNVRGLGVRALVAGNATTANVGTIGAIWLEGSTGANGYWDRGDFYGCWSENCWLPNGGTIVYTKTSGLIHHGWMHYDARKITGATGTSYMKLDPSNLGGTVSGNMVTGFLQGSARSTNDVDTGIELNQGYNYVQGVKGFPGHNVTIDSTIRESFILLAGNGGSGSTTVGIDDNSGRQDNTKIDTTNGTWVIAASSGLTPQMTIGGQQIQDLRTTVASASGSLTPDMTGGATVFEYTLSGNASILSPTDTGQRERPLTIGIAENATGGFTVTSWSASYVWKSGSPPTLVTTANAKNGPWTFRYMFGAWYQV